MYNAGSNYPSRRENWFHLCSRHYKHSPTYAESSTQLGNIFLLIEKTLFLRALELEKPLRPFLFRQKVQYSKHLWTFAYIWSQQYVWFIQCFINDASSIEISSCNQTCKAITCRNRICLIKGCACVTSGGRSQLLCLQMIIRKYSVHLDLNDESALT